jgi:DNA-directed RNA polymerase specialized sigma24 family protein
VADTHDLPAKGGKVQGGIDFLEVARQAALSRAPDRMLEALAASGLLDGITRRLENRWRGRIPRPEIEDCVALAVDSAYDAVSSGRMVRNLGAWIWKASYNLACDRWTDDYERRSTVEPEVLEDRQSLVTEDDRRLADHRAAEAVRLARSLLPRIGQGQIIDVMTILIEAAEQGIQDLPPDAIAETLGLSPAAVRSLLSRGLERLEREARREGVTLPEAVPALIRGAGDEDDPKTEKTEARGLGWNSMSRMNSTD